MKISYKHLLNLLKEKPSIEEVSEKLIQLGHENEILDSILDIEFTPNRGDCLSLQGLARDLNVFFKTNLELKIYDKEISKLDLNFENKLPDKCPRISFLNIKIENTVESYKDYLNDYFNDFKLNKNNFFADVSNYIAYEMGQPTHSYDFDLINNEITLEENSRPEQFHTLLGSKIDLQGSNMVFTSNGKIINLSGVVGGIDTACSKNTKNALIECAYFVPESIIGKSIKYNLHSDASYKFERGTDPYSHNIALRRFIQIVSEHTNILKLELYSENKSNISNTELDFNLDKVNKILGTNITKRDYIDSLTKLGFVVNEKIKVPSYRHDINHQNDLAEELSRVIGYSDIPIKDINLKHLSNKSYSIKTNKIKSYLFNNGFVEVINSPFCSVSSEEAIKVDNPLDSNRGFLRTNIINSIVSNVIYNEKRQKDSIKIFEIADIYTFDSKIKKEKKIAIVISGRRGENHIDFNKSLDDKYLGMLLDELGINVNKNIINFDKKNLNSKNKTPIYGIEIKLEDINEDSIIDTPALTSSINLQYQKISEYPSSLRDLSFAVKDLTKVNDVIDILSQTKSDIIKKSFMFDFYENNKTNEIKIGYRFIFQSQKKTLTDDEIDYEIKKIIVNVLSVKSVFMPGKS